MRPPEKLVYTWQWDNDSALGYPRGDTLVTVEFRDRGAGTELVVTHERFATARARDEHAEGWKGCLDRLVTEVLAPEPGLPLAYREECAVHSPRKPI